MKLVRDSQDCPMNDKQCTAKTITFDVKSDQNELGKGNQQG